MKLVRIILIQLCCLLGTLSSLGVYGQVVANFTASATTGCAPLVVNFTNTSQGATSYSWSLGNSNTSTLTNASTSYLTPGTYTVTLTATGSSGTDTKTLQIVVQQPPTLSFSVNDTLICKGGAVTFTNNTNLNAPGAGTYSWNFGDGNNSAAQNPTHQYNATGYFNVTLTATNSNGCVTSQVVNSLVHVLPLPVAQFATSNNNFCGAPAVATFTNLATGSSPLSYAWSFGDNNSSSSTSPIHTYMSAGVYTVQEIVTDSHGCKDTITVTNDVSVQNLHATMNVPDTGCVNQNVLFQNTSIGTGVTSFWIFGDGITSTNTNTFHAYNVGGIFTIKLVAYSGGCSDTTTKHIYIRPTPVTGLTFTPHLPCPAPVNVQFTPTAPSGSTYLWHFGDGDSSFAATPSHTYNIDSTFPVSLTISNGGCSYFVYDSVIINRLLLFIDSPRPNTGCANTLFAFHEIAAKAILFGIPILYPSPIISYSYTFGDGSPSSSLAAPHHAYATPGIYHTSFSLTTANGCTMSDTSSVYIGQPPILDSFHASPLHICRRDSLTVRAYAHGLQPISYSYIYVPPIAPPGCPDCHGGINDTLDKNNYALPGTYHSYVTASNYGCPSADTGKFTIIVDSPGAAFTFTYHCDNPLTVSFHDSSLGATSVVWLFGDGDTSTATNPTHTYAAHGAYNVLMATYSSKTGCHDTTIHGIQTLNFRPKILVADTAICQYQSLTFTASFNMPNPNQQLNNWYINNGTFPVSGFTTFSYPFNVPGMYTITLVDLDANGCNDTANQKILVAHPQAWLSATPTNICVPAQVTLIDSSHYTTGTYPVSHHWILGDGSTITTSNDSAVHQFTTPGSFYIKEVVTDNIGCMDSIYRLNYVNTHKPSAAFAVANTHHCAGDTITFINSGTQNLQSVYWTFGDGTSSTSFVPVHSYFASGSYTVTMAITDTAGCRDTLIRPSYISISKPHAAFTQDHGSGVCLPLIVQFTNASTNAVTYAWSFGNSSTSVATNPSNAYNTLGNYNIQLVVSDAAGCKDTASGHVTVYGYSGAFSYNPLAGCPPVNVNFNANITGIPNITWDFADGTVTAPSANTTASHTYTNPGKYVPKIILLDSAGCHTSNYGTDTIKVDKIHAGFRVSNALCIYDTVRFTDTSSGLFTPATSWLWYLGDGAGAIAHNPNHNYHTTGSFIVTLIATNAAGCKDTAVNTIVIHALPVITASGDTTICPSDSALVTASGAIAYLWAPAATIHCPACNPTFVAPILPTTYTVTGTDGFGCKNIDSVKIAFKYKTVSYPGAGGQICLGQSITLSDSGAQVYSWYPTTGLSDPHSAHPVASPTGSTTYLAIGKTAGCIPDTGTVPVVVNPLPMVTAVAGNSIVIAGGKVNLQASGPNIVSFLWNHADLLNCDTCTDPIATMQQTTVFTVTATNQFGCKDSTHVLVNVLCDKSQVFIPNSFTPNGDGQNDVFFPRGIGIKMVKSFRIYNRWGELVFQRNDFNLNDESKGWDGTYNGGKPIADTYVYALDATCDDGQPISWKGDVTLLK